ncbi:energy transducer TonB [Porticoccaceae bacterium LTM1]|nr:energy transducer TonB [Porticoccaceae bacterium LTM1]
MLSRLLIVTLLGTSPSFAEQTGDKTGDPSPETNTSNQPDETPTMPVTGMPNASNPSAESDLTESENPNTVLYYQDEIERYEVTAGAYDGHMSELYFSLGKSLQQDNQHVDAIDAFRHSLHVNRVNNGIHSLTQEPMLRGMIESQNALDNYIEVTRNYSQLLWIYEKTYGFSAPELIPVLEEASNWHQKIYELSDEKNAAGHLIQSIALAGSAVDIATENFGNTSLQLIHLLKNIAYSSYQLANHYGQYRYINAQDRSNFQITRNSSFARLDSSSLPMATGSSDEERIWQDSYNSGLMAYQRIIDILNDNDAEPQLRATALVQLGDWFTLFKRRSSALDVYEQAWNLLTEVNDLETLDKLLGSPERLPDFDRDNGQPLPDQLARIEMRITSDGLARDIEILETYPANDEGLEQSARRILRNWKFRPRFEKGKPVETEGYVLNLHIHK